MRALWWMFLLGFPLLSQVVVAGPNAGGTLILHADASVVYTFDETAYCGGSGLAACSLAVVRVPADPEVMTVFYALAAFPPPR